MRRPIWEFNMPSEEKCLTEPDRIEIDKETAKELLEYIEHQYIKARYTRVHALVKRLYEFTGAQ